jgi:NACalpha-BTF3-like transcription factor
MSLFDFVNSINSGKDIMDDEAKEKSYTPLLVNRSLSYFNDTVFIVNQINRYPNVDKKLQYHYLINTIKPRKRFSKWAKKYEDSDIDFIMEHYNYSYEKATTALSLLTKQQVEALKNKYNKGGIQ